MRLFFALLIVISSNALADNKPLLTWYITNWPPAFILDGPRKSQGYADQIIDILEDELPDYQHKRTFLPYPRLLKYIERGEEGCYPTNVYEEKANYGVTSVPHVLVSGHSIYIHKDNKDKFPSLQEASLVSLLNNPKLILGVRADLEFGPIIAPILKAHENDAHLFRRSGQDLVDGLVKMLHRKRIDYFIEYSFVMKFGADKIGASMNDFIEIPMLENKTEFIRGTVECPDTPWGRDVIAKINTILINTRGAGKIRDLNESWFLSPTNKHHYWDKYQTLVLDIKE